MRILDLREKLSDLPKEFIVTMVIDAPDYVQTNIDALKVLVNEKKLSGVYLTVNRPYENIKALLEASGVDADKLFFIDAVTMYTMGKSKRTEKCLYVASPKSLTDISIALSQAVKAMPEDEKFLFLDSISALLIYNQVGTAARFIHMLTIKIREWKISGVLISLKKETDEKLFSRLSQFSDRVLVTNGVM